jgi:HlyD family secretion protein
MRTSKLFIYFAWLIAVGILIFITINNKNMTNSFLGLTESKEKSLNFPFPVQVKKLYVVVGQKVTKGEKLAEVSRVNINSKLSTIDYKINELVAKKIVKEDNIHSQLKAIELKEYQELSQLDFQIKEYQKKEDTNQKLLQTIQANQTNYDSILHVKIKSLQKKRDNLKKLYALKKSNILDSLETINNPLEEQIKDLKHKKTLLEKDNSIIALYAPYDGDIGNVNYTENQSIKEFAPIISIHPLYPSYVTGYIHEDIPTDIKINQEVIVHPLSQLYKEEEKIKGYVRSISTRIVNFPLRLKKYKIVPLWGYKVLIEIPKNNLKLGQKVSISMPIENNQSSSTIFQKLNSIKLH